MNLNGFFPAYTLHKGQRKENSSRFVALFRIYELVVEQVHKNLSYFSVKIV